MMSEKRMFKVGNVLTLPVRAAVTRSAKGLSTSHYLTLPAFFCRLKGIQAGDSLQVAILGAERHKPSNESVEERKREKEET